MNQATRINVAVLGTVFGISGMSHGFFEMLQGNVPTGGFFIYAIGEAHRMWPHGNEPAITLLPNFLWTGMAAMITGLAVIVWSLGFVHRRTGPSILILLFLLLLFVGGGIGWIVFFPFLWLASTRIHQPLSWWRNILPVTAREVLAGYWPGSLIASSLLLVVALEIATTGFVPAVKDPETALSVMLTCLGLELIAFPMTWVTGFAHDLLGKSNPYPAKVSQLHRGGR